MCVGRIFLVVRTIFRSQVYLTCDLDLVTTHKDLGGQVWGSTITCNGIGLDSGLEWNISSLWHCNWMHNIWHCACLELW